MILTDILENGGVPPDDTIADPPSGAIGGIAGRACSRGRDKGRREEDYSQTVIHSFRGRCPA